MNEHDLKCWPDEFEAMARGDKTADIRRDDRGFEVGDILVQREWDTSRNVYTGRELRFLVTHRLAGGQLGLPAGFCMMSVTRLPPLEKRVPQTEYDADEARRLCDRNARLSVTRSQWSDELAVMLDLAIKEIARLTPTQVRPHDPRPTIIPSALSGNQGSQSRVAERRGSSANLEHKSKEQDSSAGVAPVPVSIPVTPPLAADHISKEWAYDSLIHPLVIQITDLCGMHDIPHVMTFELDPRPGSEPVMCSSVNSYGAVGWVVKRFSQVLDELSKRFPRKAHS